MSRRRPALLLALVGSLGVLGLALGTAPVAAATASAGSAATASATPESATPESATPESATAGSAARAATTLYRESVPPLATIGGVRIDGAAYGSSFVARPSSPGHFYGLTDRGPNVDGPDGVKVEPVPSFTPAIGEFTLSGTRAILVRTITLKAADGTPYDGQTSLSGSTGETIVDLDGTPLPASPYGYDPEGLAAMGDGTFWVSDEYGPFVTHFSAAGRQLERLTPFDGSLPVELSEREPNKGMEGLTVTPDGRTLVGIMQAGLNAPDGPESKKSPLVRIVTIDLASRQVRQYPYLLHTTDDGVDTAVSEISALSDHELVVDERDGETEPGANKKLYRVDLRGATDIGKLSTVARSTYDAFGGGLLVRGKTLEGTVGEGSTATATTALGAVGVRPVRTTLFLDVAGLVTAINPAGKFFGHDKVEGVAVLDGGRRVVLSNDSDFGIDGLTDGTAPYRLAVKTLPDGTQDAGQLLEVDLSKVPAQFR